MVQIHLRHCTFYMALIDHTDLHVIALDGSTAANDDMTHKIVRYCDKKDDIRHMVICYGTKKECQSVLSAFQSIANSEKI